MATPHVYVAIAPELVRELALDTQLTRLEGVADVERWAGPGAPGRDVVNEALRRVQVIITGWGTPSLTSLAEWTPEAFPLRLVAHTAGTIKQLVPVEAIGRGLPVTHANESLAESVAEFTVGILITARRQVVPSAIRMKAGQPALPLAQMRELGGSTVGVIGASAIGRRVMRLLHPFNVNILLFDPYCPAPVAAEYGATLVGLDELMRQSDSVTLHAPVTPETLRMLGADQFAAMKDGALFVNTARGRLIDAEALLRELRSGRIYAVLDVTDPTEPLPLDSPFLALENCLVLPHMAAVTAEARERQGRYTVDEILRFLSDEPLRYRITRERWDTMA